MTRPIAVRFLGFLERVAGQRETSLAVEESATVLDVLILLGERLGPKFTASIFRAPREVHTHFRVFINDDEAAVNDPVVAEGEAAPRVALLLMPIFEGGCR